MPVNDAVPGGPRSYWTCPLPTCRERQPLSSPTAKAASAYLNKHLSEAHGGLAGVAAAAVSAWRESPTHAGTIEALADLEALLADRYHYRMEDALAS